MSDAPFVSVIIPVFGAARGLEACLDALAQQSYARDRFEVIVVDNASPDVAAKVAGHPIRLLREPQPGSYSARNTGLRHARGDVLAFTDDDCLPAPDWLACGVAALAAPEATGIVAGEIRIAAPRPAHVSPATYAYSAIFSFRGEEDGPGYGATANLFVRRDVFDRIGAFDTSLFSGGDWAWGRRAHIDGIPTRRHPDVRVVHQVRASVAALVRRELRLAGGMQIQCERLGPTRGRRAMIAEIVMRELRRQPAWALRVIQRTPAEVSRLERTKVVGLVVVVQALRAAERLRIYLGGTPRRG